MSILSSAEPIGFRCTRCFNVNCSTSDLVGTEVNCEHCSEPLTVPEATPERIKQGLELQPTAELAEPQSAVQLATLVDYGLNDAEEMTDAEIFREARRSSISGAGPEGLVCSRWRRFFASIVDSVAVMFSFGVSFVAMIVMNFQPADFEPETLNFSVLIVALTPMLMLQVVQWTMIAMDGRTIGKYCLNIKIVNLQGNPPGFFQGVILRVWGTALLSMIPFFSLIDAFVIFANETKRCLHDFYSGTYVIEAS